MPIVYKSIHPCFNPAFQKYTLPTCRLDGTVESVQYRENFSTLTVKNENGKIRVSVLTPRADGDGRGGGGGYSFTKDSLPKPGERVDFFVQYDRGYDRGYDRVEAKASDMSTSDDTLLQISSCQSATFLESLSPTLLARQGESVTYHTIECFEGGDCMPVYGYVAWISISIFFVWLGLRWIWRKLRK